MAISIYTLILYINLFFLFYRSLNFAIHKSGNYKKQRNKHKIDKKTGMLFVDRI